jgi:MFS family permease
MTQTHTPPTGSDMKLVIAASAMGTLFEWYDFFIYGTLGSILSKAFFPSDNATLAMLLFWLVFAVGFGFRPLGAVLFGFLGDRLGRKYTFLVTVSLMGVATAGVGLIPPASSIGLWAPAIVIVLRVAQGLALGGEYGGAAVYVAEHAPANRRGFYTSFIQVGVVGGFILSLIVVLGCKTMLTADQWAAWGWRLPFLLSLFLLAISLFMRAKLSESPVFQAMREAGETAKNPFVESFTYPGNLKRIFVALFGVSAGMTVIWYTSMFSPLAFLTGPMRMDDTAAQLIVGAGAILGVGSYVLFGALSDRVGRKWPVTGGHLGALLLVFPVFWGMGALANPGLALASARAPVVVSGPACTFNPFAGEQPGDCGKLLSDLTALGVSYTVEPQEAGTVALSIGGMTAPHLSSADKPARRQQLQARLTAAGYNFARVTPTWPQAAGLVALVVVLVALAGAAYGPLSALLTEMFPPRIRYSSLSIPYHIGTGYFGGFLPLIAAYIAARSGNPYAGNWYMWGVALMAFVVSMWGLKGGPPRDDFEGAE